MEQQRRNEYKSQMKKEKTAENTNNKPNCNCLPLELKKKSEEFDRVKIVVLHNITWVLNEVMMIWGKKRV